MLHIIADSGLQFHTIEVEFDPAQQLTLPAGRPLKYSFCNIKNPDTGERIFDLLSYNSAVGRFIPVNGNSYQPCPWNCSPTDVRVSTIVVWR